MSEYLGHIVPKKPLLYDIRICYDLLMLILTLLQKWTPHTLFTLFWYPTLHMRNFHFSSFGFLWYLKIISPRVCKKIFWLKQKNLKYFCIGCLKSALRGGKTKFVDFFHRSIRNKKLGKVKNFQVWVAWRLFE